MSSSTGHCSSTVPSLSCERSNAMLSEFAGRVSHDLRAPLTTILGYVELAEDDPGIPHDHPAKEYLEHIGNGGQRMLGTLEDVLDYARADGQLNRERVSLLAVTAEAAQDLGLDLGLSSGILCEDAELYADRAQLRTLVQNLLANSLNYQDLQRDLKVTVTATTCPRGVTIHVADNGKGILPSERSRARGTPGAAEQARRRPRNRAGPGHVPPNRPGARRRTLHRRYPGRRGDRYRCSFPDEP